mmetsp:Transcript_17297/g.28427  ORF Transcript_17297/g.28427 Transcript_17297/m.28427 type:complete len:372 (-) Transcript_17297:112-1227(-)
MGAAISSSAAAAAESLAEDSLLENNTSDTAAAPDDNEEASPSPAAAATVSSSPIRRTSRKIQPTDFYAPCERINLEAEAEQKSPKQKSSNSKQESPKKEKENDASSKALINQKELEDKWENYRQELIKYKKEHGTYFVSIDTNKKLARWADNQRQFHRRGKMNDVRIGLLQEIGFFDEKKPKKSPAKSLVKSTLDEMWEENRQALIANKIEHNGSFSFHPKSKLGRWVENQRRALKLGKLSEERATLLNEIDIDQLDERRVEAIRKSVDAMWEKTRQELIAYKEEHGDYSVPPKSTLGRWIENQKRAYKLYDMPAERAELMQQMGLFPQRPEDMVDGRKSPRKKRKKSYHTEEKDEGDSSSKSERILVEVE